MLLECGDGDSHAVDHRGKLNQKRTRPPPTSRR
ncbi:hypothetical protein FHS27_005308 [Rhodopirellula rubra]|uniref:Uncharacterized protein n=1 Tax=Aporhodopirellula rubra TaxID=980271 RepID=A0A7W5H8H0_9BACT|nr:hypothetical protein [Aporhodopirellula rubra]